MTHRPRDPPAGSPVAPEQLPPRPATAAADGGASAGRSARRVAGQDGASFAAGWGCGTRTAAIVARAAALELLEHARWWNRWRRRLMARALVACAEELESAAEEDGEALRAHGGAAPHPPGFPVDVLVRRERGTPTRIH